MLGCLHLENNIDEPNTAKLPLSLQVVILSIVDIMILIRAAVRLFSAIAELIAGEKPYWPPSEKPFGITAFGLLYHPQYRELLLDGVTLQVSIFSRSILVPVVQSCTTYRHSAIPELSPLR